MSTQQDKSRHADKSAGTRSSTSADKPVSLDAEDIHSGNIDKIRAILFGSHMRDYEVRFTRIEERLSKEVLEMREDLRRRADSLEGYVRQEVEALSSRIRNEYTERAEAIKDLAGTLENLNKVFEKRTRQLDDELNKGQRELRQAVLDQGKGLSDKIRTSNEEILSMVERELSQMRAGKVDRSALANLFTDLAIRLNNGIAQATE